MATSERALPPEEDKEATKAAAPVTSVVKEEVANEPVVTDVEADAEKPTRKDISDSDLSDLPEDKSKSEDPAASDSDKEVATKHAAQTEDPQRIPSAASLKAKATNETSSVAEPVTATPDSTNVTTPKVQTYQQKKPPPSPSIQQQRKSGGTGRGLSELSKQLRVLQAKNESQSVEIDRLERQLRILADLQGISVADLRRALQEACEAEAFGELQHRVASLRAQLEAASLAKQRTAASEDAAASAHKIANLELRIGELEEVEEKQRAEIQKLYSDLMEQKANVTRLESLCEHQRSENERLLKEQTKEPKTEAIVDASQAMNTDSKEYELLMTEKAAVENKLRETEVELQVLKDKLALSEQQRRAAEEQSKLRHAQFKARFLVQDEKIQDLEQQLSSLYVAFEMLREERTQEDAKRAVLESSLHAADAQVARDLDSSHRSDSMSLSSPSFHHIIPESPMKEASSTVYIPPTDGEAILSGTLLIQSNKFMKKYKQREAYLFSTLAHHTLNISGDQFRGGLKLQFGISTVEPCHKQPHGFVIHVDPNNHNEAVVHAAALTEQQYHQWMTALTAATTGEEYEATVEELGVIGGVPTYLDEDESYREHSVL